MVRYRRQSQHAIDPDAPLRPRRRRRGVALLPALFTLGNCLCGFASINYAARDDTLSALTTQPTYHPPFAIAGYFIFAAMLFDMFDGFVARLTRSASDFGAELDSLADMVSFGIAPAFLSIRLITDLLHKINIAPGMKTLEIPGPFSDDAGRLFWIFAAIYVSCTALRLARFNVINKHEISSHLNFRGMPSPGAAAVVASTVIFFETINLPPREHVLPFNVPPSILDALKTVFPYVLPVVLLCAALLMVSRYRYSHLINRFLRGRKKFRDVVFYLCLFMLILWEPQISALIAIYIYALSAPVTWLYRLATGKKPPTQLPPASPSPTPTPTSNY